MSERPSPARRFRGVVTLHQEPDWSPLLALVDTDLAGWFTWMGEIALSDGAVVHVFRHRDTRRSLHVALDGRTFLYDPNDGSTNAAEPRYVECGRLAALDAVLGGWERMWAGREAAWLEVSGRVDVARRVAGHGATFDVDPRELELQRAFEAKRYGKAA